MFISEQSGEIFSAKPNGRDVKRLTESGGNRISANPDWSPDGQRIAFSSDRVDVDGQKDAVQIYLMNADGSGVAQLTRGPGRHANPAWSPDATSLAIESDWGGGRAQQGIWIIPASDPDGVTQAEARRLTTPPQGADLDAQPQYSPDGNAIAFTRFKSPRRSAIYRVDIDGTGLERLTPWRLNASDPDWSPDGRRIAFDSGEALRRDSKSNVHVMRADGTKRKALTNFARTGLEDQWAQNPVWSPDGRKIMYQEVLPEGVALKTMRPNGSRKRVALTRPRFPNLVDWGTHP